MGCGKSSVGRRLSELLCCPFMDLDSVIEEYAGKSIPEIFTADGEAAFRAIEQKVLEALTGGGKMPPSDLEDNGIDPTYSRGPLPQSGPLPLAGGGKMPPSDLGNNGIDPTYSRGPLPQSGPLPLAGGGKMPLTYDRVNAAESEMVVLALGGGTVMTPECAELVQNNTRCIYLKASVETLVEHLAGEAAGRPMLADADLRPRIETLMQQRAATYEKNAHMIIDTDGKTVDEIASAISYAWSTKH